MAPKKCMTKKPKAKAADEGSPLPVEAPKKGKKPKAGVTVEVQAVVLILLRLLLSMRN